MKQSKRFLQVAIILTTILLTAGSVMAEPQRKGKKKKLTKQQIKKTMERIEQHKPELARELRDIRQEDPKLFRKKIKYMRNQWIKKHKEQGGKAQMKDGKGKHHGNKWAKHHPGKRGMKKGGMGKGPKAFGNKGEGRGHKQWREEFGDRTEGRKYHDNDMMYGKGRGKQDMTCQMDNNRKGRGKGKQGRKQWNNKRQGRGQHGMRKQSCWNCGASPKNEMSGQGRGRRRHNRGGQMGDRGRRRPHSRQW